MPALNNRYQLLGFNKGGMPPPAVQPDMSAIPPTPASWGGGAGLDMANINYILNPFFDTTETRTNAAEANLGAGTSGSAFGAGTTNRLLESEKLARFQLGHQLLEPYNQRSFQAAENASDRAARLNEIAQQGAQALQQLQLQEAGATARASASERAAMERAIEQGRQAMAQLNVQEAGQSSRTGAQIAGNLANTRLGIIGDLARTELSKPARALTNLYPNSESILPVTASGEAIGGAPRATPSVSGSPSNSIDAILRKYNLL